MTRPRRVGSPQGLRERKKAVTRTAIADAAFELVRDRGVDAVTIEEIADRAMVSPRTFSNYFASKEAAVLHAGHVEPEALLAGFDDRPTEEPPLVALDATLRVTIRALTPEQTGAIRATEELVERDPALLPFRMAQFDRFEAVVRRAVARRLGVEDAEAAYPRLVAGAAVSAVRTALRQWMLDERGDAASLASLVEQYLVELAAGLPPEAASAAGHG